MKILLRTLYTPWCVASDLGIQFPTKYRKSEQIFLPTAFDFSAKSMSNYGRGRRISVETATKITVLLLVGN